MMNRIRYKVTRDDATMIPAEDNIAKARLKLFGDLKKSTNVPMRMCERINILECERDGVRAKKNFNKVTRIYLVYSI